jgi:glycosyltransferase involved in cell wall biosynthesis
MMNNLIKGKTIIFVSLWGYPFGGGEEYLYQTATWLSKYNANVYWLSFSLASQQNYTKLSIKKTNNFTEIKIPDGLDINTLYNWLKLLNPDIVHHQGHYRKLFYEVCEQLRVPFLTGIHFWSGIIDLDPICLNIDILENAQKHKANSDFLELINAQYCNLYSVSKYVSECIKKITNIDIKYMCYSGSSKLNCECDNKWSFNNKYVTIINIHKLKGGELLLYLLKKLKKIPFLVVRTEYMSEELDSEILNIINERNNDGYSAQSLFLERTKDIKFIYSNTRIMLASSLVDETFCRTVNETMMNYIPVITTGQGNLKYLVEGAGLIINLKTDPVTKNIYQHDLDNWKDTLENIYFDKNLLEDMSYKTKLKYEEYSEDICSTMFINVISECILNSKNYNVMILSPWCDQGLGIQSRNYYNVLKHCGFRVFIFSLKPYCANSAIELQKDPSEWIVDNIYYSPNDREHVTNNELLDFIAKYNIGKCLIPETCWFRIFEIAKLLRDNDVKCYAIPNIEIVRKDEIAKHKYFYKILCNNLLCKQIFEEHNITNTKYIGYGIYNNKNLFKVKKYNGTTNFLFIGGMNAFSRKHILEICEGFSIAFNTNSNIKLTCTIQKTNLLELDDKNKIEKYTNHPGITLIQTHLSYDDIINLYHEHHVSIQVSKHEGLGLGFYEALLTQTPIITLDTPPHNEIVIEGINGWVIPCYYKTMTDNTDSLIKSAYFDPVNLANKIIYISKNRLIIQQIYSKLLMDYDKRLSGDKFCKKIIKALE